MTSSSPTSIRSAARAWSRPAPHIWAVLAFCLAATLVAARTAHDLHVPGNPQAPHYGMADFRDAIYFPVVAWLEGHNPYDPADFRATYPVTASFAPYAPHTLVVHLPFGVLPPRLAASLYFVVTLALLAILAHVVLQLGGVQPTTARTFALAAAFVLSRPGQSTLFLGQYSISVALGVALALACAGARPGLSALGVALSAVKMTYGAPLVVFMVARGDWRPAAAGLALAAILAAAPIATLTASVGGLRGWLEVFTASQRSFMDTQFFETDTTVTRFDAASLFGRWLGAQTGAWLEPIVAIGMLAVAALLVWALVRRRSGRGATAAAGTLVSTALICVTILGCVYHQGYDGLLLAVPLVALLAQPRAWPLSAAVRWLLVGLLALPMVNYAATFLMVDGLGLRGMAWRIVTSLNAAAILAAWLLLVAAALRLIRRPPPGTIAR